MEMGLGTVGVRAHTAKAEFVYIWLTAIYGRYSGIRPQLFLL